MSVLPQVAVLGGGLAGSAAAITLARAGCRVLLVEKESQPHHKVCGEFLSHEAVGYLQALGIAPSAFGAATLHGVRLASARKVTTARLPFTALSLTRCALDEELLHLAAAAGATLLRGHRVERIDLLQHSIALDNGETLTAPSIFLATGKHDLRAHPRPAGSQPNLVGFKMYLRLASAQQVELAGHVELLLYPGGYGGLQPVEGTAANLCCLVHRDALQRVGNRWENLLGHMQASNLHLAQRLAGAQPLLEKPLAITSIPYGFVRRRTVPGLWHLGDQAAVIPSFTGDGMSIALHTGILAAQMYLNGHSAESYQSRLHTQLHRQVALATAISRGLLHPATRKVFTAAARAWPAGLGLVARHTRIADEASVAGV